MNNPTPTEIRQAREIAGLTQTKAAALIHCGLRAWQRWEAGDRKMHPAMWELFQTKARKDIYAEAGIDAAQDVE